MKITHPCENDADLALMSDGAEIMIRRWNTGPSQRILISHGNGLAVDGFRAFGEALMDEFEVIAFDLRNHGRSPGRPEATDHWPRFIADIPEIWAHVEAAFGPRPTHGAFHSMSSVCTLLSQLDTPLPWQSLSLFEPPIPPGISVDFAEDFRLMHEQMATRCEGRRRRFESPEQLVRSFLRADAFRGIPENSVRMLAEASLLRDDADPQCPWRLACPPEVEARNYLEAGALSKHWPELGRIDVPVQIVLGDEAEHSQLELVKGGRLTAETFGFASVTIPSTNHFMQLQRPRDCAEAVIAFAQAQNAYAINNI